MTRAPFTSSVPGRGDLTCPIPRSTVAAMLRHARAHPWAGNKPLDCPHHLLDTTAITEPGRKCRVLLSEDYGYHNSGWFANSDYESCLHISVSYPRPEVPRAYRARPELGMPQDYTGMDLETPTDAEVGRGDWCSSGQSTRRRRGSSLPRPCSTRTGCRTSCTCGCSWTRTGTRSSPPASRITSGRSRTGRRRRRSLRGGWGRM